VFFRLALILLGLGEMCLDRLDELALVGGLRLRGRSWQSMFGSNRRACVISPEGLAVSGGEALTIFLN
jgi:hypothetical protein